jgi:hypothetical protein
MNFDLLFFIHPNLENYNLPFIQTKDERIG